MGDSLREPQPVTAEDVVEGPAPAGVMVAASAEAPAADASAEEDEGLSAADVVEAELAAQDEAAVFADNQTGPEPLEEATEEEGPEPARIPHQSDRATARTGPPISSPRIAADAAQDAWRLAAGRRTRETADGSESRRKDRHRSARRASGTAPAGSPGPEGTPGARNANAPRCRPSPTC